MKKIISTPKAPAAIGPYSQAIEVNNTIYISGQLPIDVATGEFPAGGIKEQTQASFNNIKAILAEVGLTTEHIVKTTVLLADMNDFAQMNEVYTQQFEGTYPARSAFAVKALPKGALVEIEVIAVR
ncbi:RidA family protein [Bacteroides propionicifaciens]|jgi:2-iminobutanoate/2-iminopropanoate deaminase|uniref:RidA family protein n=1 Tax=Bacteroides propionicifaciens TaxID=392838 RepID=UPI0003623F45|nr:RidA family protein [Bacteroides propionicifaciens]